MDKGAGMEAELTWGRLALGLAGAVALALIVGAYPTWSHWGAMGLQAAGVAVGVNLLLVVLTAFVVRAVARRKGRVAGGSAFLGSGIVRIAVVAGGGAALPALLHLDNIVYWIWALGSYFLMIGVEAYWAGRGLGRMQPAQAGS